MSVGTKLNDELQAKGLSPEITAIVMQLALTLLEQCMRKNGVEHAAQGILKPTPVQLWAINTAIRRSNIPADKRDAARNALLQAMAAANAEEAVGICREIEAVAPDWNLF